MRITAVTAQKHDPERVNLYIDGEFRCGLCIQTAADFGLAPGRELSPRELNDIAAADAYPAALNAALDYASRTNAKSRSEFLARLSDFPEKAAQAAVKRMEELGYLNEAAYAARIVEVYSARGFGEKKLRDELYRRGVPREEWDEALARVEDSTQAIDDFLQKKLTGWTGDRKQLQKVTAALARRGFSWSDIRDALARYETGIDIEYD